ncbi:ArsR family transcriptional regulator [Kitasatospora griseola]|uniref:ArsR family transcriptional regulator n=1 Tax=Kitasatospora griseola TaxID=2064 RepID=UPI00382F2C42
MIVRAQEFHPGRILVAAGAGRAVADLGVLRAGPGAHQVRALAAVRARHQRRGAQGPGPARRPPAVGPPGPRPTGRRLLGVAVAAGPAAHGVRAGLPHPRAGRQQPHPGRATGRPGRAGAVRRLPRPGPDRRRTSAAGRRVRPRPEDRDGPAGGRAAGLLAGRDRPAPGPDRPAGRRTRRPATTTELGARTGLSAPTVSHHLHALHDAGLAARHRTGRTVLYLRTAAAELLCGER